VKDNRSHNGTFWNERKLASGERKRLETGDAIRFGAYPVYVIMPADVRRILETMGPVYD
jgi:pSer/pThr/pTyr-binding forkhead associated (FHA) protein